MRKKINILIVVTALFQPKAFLIMTLNIYTHTYIYMHSTYKFLLDLYHFTKRQSINFYIHTHEIFAYFIGFGIILLLDIL